MSSNRLPLVTMDLLRELCPSCKSERFQFVPSGEETAAGACQCGSGRELVELSDTSIRRLMSPFATDIRVRATR